MLVQKETELDGLHAFDPESEGFIHIVYYTAKKHGKFPYFLKF